MSSDGQKLTTVELNSDEFKVIQAQIATLNKQLSVAQAVASKEKSRSEELNNLQERLKVDFDNYRKRTAEDVKKQKDKGATDVIEKILPLTDTLHNAIAMIHDEQSKEGIRMVLRQFEESLRKIGVTEIKALGEPFDPNFHNAIAQVKVKDLAQADLVVEVLQKGYRMGDLVIRYSIVKVGK